MFNEDKHMNKIQKTNLTDVEKDFLDEGFMPIRYQFVGVSPMLMNRFPEPTSDDAAYIAEISKKRNKQDADHEELYRRSWMISMHLHRGKPYMPMDNILKCLYSAAKSFREGPKFVGETIIDSIVLNHDMPADLDEAWRISRDEEDERSWVDIRPVRVQQSRVMRSRAKFFPWSVDLIVWTANDSSTVDRWCRTAGIKKGLGDYRVEKGGQFGRFKVVLKDLPEHYYQGIQDRR